MISDGLMDEECPKEIREFVRSHKHIRFDHHIDKGYNGIVYFGKRIKMQEDVVVKFYLSNEDYDSSEEAVILRKIDHYNVLKVDDLRYMSHNNSYFLSPKISGGDLQALIDSQQILSTKRTLAFVQGILCGLSELHTEHKLVHRDLKPGNLLFRLKDDSPVIADLGSVKKIDETTGYVTASKSTSLFLPPESIFENKYYFESDIYQIGIVLYQLLGGYFPLETPLDFLNQRENAALEKIKGDSIKWGRMRSELMNNKIAKSKLLNLNSLPNCLNARFKKIIKIATHPDYTKRFNNVSEFLTEINKLLRDFPDYSFVGSEILISHQNGSQFKIGQNGHNSFVIEKLMTNGKWRRNNKHNGSFSEVMNIANKN